jgi:Uma2 family endonuclease
MATGTSVSVQEYLHTPYQPDCDYVDGVVVERNLGEYDHAKLQGELQLHVYPSLRMQVSSTRFRVPDLCVVVGEEPKEQILTQPPFLCIEVLSVEDRLNAQQKRCRDFVTFGVPYVWILDPRKQKAYRVTAGGMHEVTELRTENPEILVPLATLFE